MLFLPLRNGGHTAGRRMLHRVPAPLFPLYAGQLRNFLTRLNSFCYSHDDKMPAKRKHQEPDAQGAVHASRQFQVYGTNPKPAKKPRRFEPPALKKQAHASSVNAIKKRIRDVTRRLERSDALPADVRIENERALTMFQQELAEAEAEKIRQKMIKKYHMVRFFERQKATRQLKKIRKRLLVAESTEEVEQLKTQMEETEVDLNYTQYHPLCEIYISLYPPTDASSNGEPSTTGVDPKPKPPIWFEVQKCMDDGTLNKLRNRVPQMAVTAQKPIVQKPAKINPSKETPVDLTGLNRRQRRAQQVEKEPGAKSKSTGFAKNKAFGASLTVQKQQPEDDSDSEGGFFE